MKNLRIIFFIVLIISIGTFLSNIQLVNAQGETKKKLHFVDASSNNFPPMNVLDKDGSLTGFGRELADAVIKEVGGEIKHIHSSRWVEVLEWLDTGKADFIHDTGYTEERDKFLDYSEPIIEMPETIFVRPDEYSITDIESLKGKTVACVNKHISHLYLKQFPEISLFVVKTPVEGIYELISGKVDAFIYPKQIVLYLVQSLRIRDKIKVTGEPLRTLTWSMVVKEGNIELLQRLNEGIAKVRKSGQYDRIYEKWWGEKVLSGYTKEQLVILTIMTTGISLAVMLSITLFFFSRKLKQKIKERTALLSQEIEERKLIEIDLEKEKEFIKAVLENIEDGIVACDKEGVLTLFNRATREFHCLPEKPIPAEEWPQYYDLFLADGTTLMQKEDVPLFCALQGAHVKNIEMVISPKQGKKRILLASGQPFLDDQGNVLGAVASMHDVTERKYAEEALKKAHDELEVKVKMRTLELQQSYEKLAKEVAGREVVESKLRQSHKMEAIGTLAGGIAHDFNNILAAILGYADMAKDDIPEYSPAKYQIDQVLKAGNRAKDLVKHILSFSRKESQERIPAQIHLIANEALKLLRASIPTTVKIQQNIDPACGNILADPTQIHQVLLNICTNAAQAMDENGGVLDVSLDCVELAENELAEGTKAGSYVRLVIKDTGEGIDPKVIERIFDPYFTTKEFGKGSGMGLAVVHGIVKSHDGMITVESNLGEGTTFSVYFPTIDLPVKEEIENAALIPTGKENILVVDDEESMVDLNKRRIERLGYRVTTKTSSMEALELFRSQPDAFDIVISDQTMPELTGVQLAKKLMEIRSDIPIIICSGYSSKIDAGKAKLIGISAFIMKPVEIMELANAIRDVLDIRN